MTIFTSALLSLALLFNAPDSAKLTETAEIPCKENYYGYEIDIGEIAGTMVAEELNEYKTEFRDFINNAIKYELKQSDAPQKSNYE